MTPAQLELWRGESGRWADLGISAVRSARRLYARFVELRCRGRIVGARTWSRIRLEHELGVDLMAVRRLLDVGIVRWDGDDLVWVDFDTRAEDRDRQFRARQAELGRLGGLETGRRWKVLLAGGRSIDRSIDRSSTTPRNHKSADAAWRPAALGCSPPEITLLRSGASVRSGSSEPPPPTRDPSTAAAGGGGGPSGGPEPEAFARWWELYVRKRPRERAAALAAWLALEMRQLSERACLEFTRGKMRTRQYTRDGGGWAEAPAVFLRDVWRPELERQRRERQARAELERQWMPGEAWPEARA